MSLAQQGKNHLKKHKIINFSWKCLIVLKLTSKTLQVYFCALTPLNTQTHTHTHIFFRLETSAELVHLVGATHWSFRAQFCVSSSLSVEVVTSQRRKLVLEW